MPHFNWYGLMVSLGIAVAYVLIRWQLQQQKTSRIAQLDHLFAVAMVGGLLGGRIWHVLTDFELYRENLLAIPAMWLGGMSIIGAVVGGALALAMWFQLQNKSEWLSETKWWLDIAVFGLPLAQAIGRIGNWFNQELYGLPTYVPWAISVVREGRILMVHPLFAYESIALLLFSAVVWYRQQNWRLGNAHLFLLYVTFYCWLRTGLESIRWDKTVVLGTTVGVNQLLVAGVGVVALGLLYQHKVLTSFWKKIVPVLIVGWLLLCFGAAQMLPREEACRWIEGQQKWWYCPRVTEYQRNTADHRRTQIAIDSQVLTVEVVNTPASITQGLSGRDQIGSEGMLFLMPGESTRPSFWMYEMKFDLDLIWIEAGKIVDITYHATAPTAQQSTKNLPIYQPRQPARMVLEVPSGTANARNWRAGSSFEWYH